MEEQCKANKMVAFSEKTLIHLLGELSISRSKILNLSSWLIHHKKYCKVVVKIWFEHFLKAHDGHKVTLLYLLNEIVQNGKKCQEYVHEFGAILPKAFNHVCSLHTFEKKLAKDIMKLLRIWSEKQIFSPKQIMSFSKLLDPSKYSKCQTTPQYVKLRDIKFKDVNELVTLSPCNIKMIKPDEEALIQRLNLLENPPTCDGKVREEIGSFPEEIFDLSTLKNVKTKKFASMLMKQLDCALELTDNYNTRLQYEMEQRKILAFQLSEFTNAEKELIFRGKDKLKRYRMKIIKLKRLQRQMESYIQQLPELPAFSKELSPLPFSGDLLN